MKTLKDSEEITADEVQQMKQVFEEAQETVSPIVTRGLADEIISYDLLSSLEQNLRCLPPIERPSPPAQKSKRTTQGDYSR